MNSMIKPAALLTTGLILALGLSLITLAGCATRSFTVETARQAAANGNAQAFYFLATHYARGEGVPKDPVQAAKFMRTAAEKGNVRAQNNYGAYCLQGFGVKPNPTEAVAWFHQAADKGDPLAMFSLGMCFERGLGTTPNVAAAVNWYRKSALNKQAEAAVALEQIYLNGAGEIKKNEAEAFAWAKLGGELGDANCLNDCGFMYEHGQGAKPNLEKAGECYLAAAQKGFAHAYSNLGRLYLDSSKLKFDPVTAYKWFLIGVDHGDGFSRHYLQEMNLKQMLTGAQKDAAKAAAQSYENKQPSPKMAG